MNVIQCDSPSMNNNNTNTNNNNNIYLKSNIHKCSIDNISTVNYKL